jgi:predicted rRNA methylase YqxC with S4 and FtsJ domains
MAKPQFEVGRAGVGKGGVVRDPGCGARRWRRWRNAAARSAAP